MREPRVLLVTFGSYGDVHPFIAMALELKAVGIAPTIATSEGYREKIEREGIGFHAVRPTMEQMLADVGLSAEAFTREITRRPVTYLIEQAVLPYLSQAYDDLLPAAADADLIAISSFAVAGQMAADKLGKPTVSVVLSPIVMMSEDDPPILEQLPILPALRRLFGPGLVRSLYQLGRRRMRALDARIDAQRRAVGLPASQGSTFIDGPQAADAVVALYSPLLGGAPRHPPKPTSLAGFAFFDRDGPGGEHLSDEAEAFLAAGAPPLVFTVGSFATLAAQAFYAEAARTARILGRRAVLLVGREAETELRETLDAPDILVLGYAPHSLLFPQAAANIHHGGVGTTGQALRAGVPQLVCPMFGDQPDNAYRVRRLGVGAALPYARFTAERAAKALKPLLSDDRIAARAREVGQGVREENGARWLAGQIAARLAAAGQRL